MIMNVTLTEQPKHLQFHKKKTSFDLYGTQMSQVLIYIWHAHHIKS